MTHNTLDSYGLSNLGNKFAIHPVVAVEAGYSKKIDSIIGESIFRMIDRLRS